MADVMDALKYPLNDKELLKKYLPACIGWIPLFGYCIVMGYFIKAIRENSQSTKDELPEWNDWGKMLFDGFMTVIINLIYYIIPSTLLCLSLIPFFIGLIMNMGLLSNERAGQIIGILGFLGPVVSIILLVIFSVVTFAGIILQPMAYAVYAVTGNILSSLNIFLVTGKIIANAGNYIIFLTVQALLAMIWVSIGLAILSVPLLGQLVVTILMVPVGLYLGLFTARFLGQMVGNP